MSLQLNECPYISHWVLGFCFHITFDEANKIGKDQWGGRWLNDAPNKNSMIPVPEDPKYLDVFIDANNQLKKYGQD